MRNLNIEGKTWLVGGGTAAPWTYGDLVDALNTSFPLAGPSVATTLLQMTWAVATGEATVLGDLVAAEEPILSPPRNSAGTRTVASLAAAVNAESTTRIGLRTSGTTDEPRDVVHTLATLTRAISTREHHREDVWGLAFNPTHIAGVQVYLQALANLNTVVNLWGIARHEAVRRCREHAVTHLSATPTFYRMLLPLSEPLPAVRSIAVGGEIFDAALLDRLRGAFPGARIHNVYASTEAGSVLAGAGLDLEVPDQLVDRVRVVDGHLWLHSSLVAAAICDAEWYDTGDLVTITCAKPMRLRITGRAEGWINVGGEKVNPRDVEAALLEHPAITAARVFGRQNSVSGNILAAELATNSDRPSETELRAYLATRLPEYRIPRIFQFVETIEMTRTGKIKRT